MLEADLVPLKTVATTKGDGPRVDISGAATRVFLLQLEITGIVEQESLNVSIFGGAEAGEFEKSPIATFPQQFYTGSIPMLLDLRAVPAVAVLQVHWEVNRWGRGPETAWFEFGVKLREIPPEMLEKCALNSTC